MCVCVCARSCVCVCVCVCVLPSPHVLKISMSILVWTANGCVSFLYSHERNKIFKTNFSPIKEKYTADVNNVSPAVKGKRKDSQISRDPRRSTKPRSFGNIIGHLKGARTFFSQSRVNSSSLGTRSKCFISGKVCRVCFALTPFHAQANRRDMPFLVLNNITWFYTNTVVLAAAGRRLAHIRTWRRSEET